jgi:hypothetical protein
MNGVGPNGSVNGFGTSVSEILDDRFLYCSATDPLNAYQLWTVTTLPARSNVWSLLL